MRLSAVLPIVLLVVVGGCSVGGPTPSGEPDGSGSAPAGVPLPCVNGPHRITGFTATGANGQTATGRGGNVQVEFRDGKYQMRGDGTSPMTLTVQDENAELLVNGTLSGTYTGSGSQLDFTADDFVGKATLRRDGEQEGLLLSQLAGLVTPQGPTTVTCGGNTLRLTSEQTTLDLQQT